MGGWTCRSAIALRAAFLSQPRGPSWSPLLWLIYRHWSCRRYPHPTLLLIVFLICLTQPPPSRSMTRGKRPAADDMQSSVMLTHTVCRALFSADVQSSRRTLGPRQELVRAGDSWRIFFFFLFVFSFLFFLSFFFFPLSMFWPFCCVLQTRATAAIDKQAGGFLHTSTTHPSYIVAAPPAQRSAERGKVGPAVRQMRCTRKSAVSGWACPRSDQAVFSYKKKANEVDHDRGGSEVRMDMERGEKGGGRREGARERQRERGSESGSPFPVALVGH